MNNYRMKALRELNEAEEQVKQRVKMKLKEPVRAQRKKVGPLFIGAFASLATMILLVFLIWPDENAPTVQGDGAFTIEVVQWETSEWIMDITDTEFIEKLMKELNRAKTVSTATVKLRSPDYKLLIIRDGETVYQLGYYKDVMQLDYYKDVMQLDGIESRYSSLKEEKMYGVTLELPTNN